MSQPSYLDPRLTERRNPASGHIDVASALEIVDAINAEDRTVPEAVHTQRAQIAAAIELAFEAFRRQGRLIYIGAGTSGRLGVLDAAEIPPTFGASPDMVIGLIAGGRPAIVRSQEGAEDDEEAAVDTIVANAIDARAFVLGIAASGTTPFVRSALEQARSLGAKTGLLSCTDPPKDVASACDVVIVPKVGPEVVTGSTRMKAGTATKLVLNTVSTGAMLRLGKVYGNLMVDLQATSEKLRDRGERILMEVAGVDRERARSAIDAAGGSVKLAIVMVKRGVDEDRARQLLGEADGFVRNVLGDPPPVADA